MQGETFESKEIFRSAVLKYQSKVIFVSEGLYISVTATVMTNDLGNMSDFT